MPNKIKWIICLDGTSNSERLDGTSLTNVSLIRQCILKDHIALDTGETDARQVTSYHDGIGTGFKNPLNALQQALGDGIDRIILDAYHYLCQNYREGDEIVLIGFSRGAYAARCLADLVDQRGLLMNSGRDKLQEVYEAWTRRNTTGDRPAPNGHRPSIKACALWDTVGSIGTPIRKGILSRRLKFVHSELPPNVEHVVQALSLHEHRYHFAPLVVHPTGRDGDRIIGMDVPTLEQCWFAGYHADIGGGCKKDALAHFALVWMISKLERWLTFDTRSLYSSGSFPTTWKVGDPCGVRYRRGTYRLPVRDSMSLGFRVGGSKYRIPQMEFWDQDGPYTKEEMCLESRERMHATARFLSQRQLVKSLKCVDGITEPQNNEDSWMWTLHSRIESWRDRFSPRLTDPAGQNIIEEQLFTPKEQKTLLEWIKKDNRQLDKNDHPAGEEEPNTVLVDLRDWLRNPRATAVNLEVQNN